MMDSRAAAHLLHEIGPDAHSVDGLDNMALGIGMTRKGWLTAGDVLKTRGVDEVVAFAQRRRHAAR